jgi:hypothetical protein
MISDYQWQIKKGFRSPFCHKIQENSRNIRKQEGDILQTLDK